MFTNGKRPLAGLKCWNRSISEIDHSCHMEARATSTTTRSLIVPKPQAQIQISTHLFKYGQEELDDTIWKHMSPGPSFAQPSTVCRQYQSPLSLFILSIYAQMCLSQAYTVCLSPVFSTCRPYIVCSHSHALSLLGAKPTQSIHHLSTAQHHNAHGNHLYSFLVLLFTWVSTKPTQTSHLMPILQSSQPPALSFLSNQVGYQSTGPRRLPICFPFCSFITDLTFRLTFGQWFLGQNAMGVGGEHEIIGLCDFPSSLRAT